MIVIKSSSTVGYAFNPHFSIKKQIFPHARNFETCILLLLYKNQTLSHPYSSKSYLFPIKYAFCHPSLIIEMAPSPSAHHTKNVKPFIYHNHNKIYLPTHLSRQKYNHPTGQLNLSTHHSIQKTDILPQSNSHHFNYPAQQQKPFTRSSQ